jgi:RimJ/RimL family protein N-acetyltransferase
VALPETVRLKDGRVAVVRAAIPADAERWIANLNAIGSERVYILTETFARTPEEIREQFRTADPNEVLWLAAEIDGTVVGGADFHRGRRPKCAHTASLGVALLPEARGVGLGAAMLSAGIDWARRSGITKLKLGVFATNDRAIALYRKLGFVEEGRLRGEARIEGEDVDEVLMARFLDDRPRESGRRL